MILLISHFTKTKGVTDYFVDYLENQNIPYYYLRHPFNDSELKCTELIHYDGKKKSIIKKYKRFKYSSIDLIRNFLITKWVIILLRSKITKIFGFGGFNVVPAILFKKLFSCKLYFWGVDYSRKRFGNIFLNDLYLFFETLSCKYCSAVINQTKRQEEARIQFHNLNRNKSIVITNGIEMVYINKDFSKYNEPAFLYIGSITNQHGIIDFINYFYVENNFPYILYIIGGGEEMKILKRIIKNYNLDKKIYYLGYKNQHEIVNFLLRLNKKLFGIAPYSDRLNDHVYYGDSLKIKEYLNYNLPYITSSVTYIPKKLQKFGITYNSLRELSESLETKLHHFCLNIKEKNEKLSTYKWENIFRKVAELVKI